MRSALSACIKLFNIMACVLLLAMVVVMFLAIVMRQFGVLIPGSEEIATFSMVGVAFLGLPGVYTAGMHVRVETLYSRLAAPRQKALDIWCLAVAIAVCLVFAYFTGLLAWDSYRLGDAAFGLLAIPLWIPQLPMPLGLGLLILVMLDDIVRLVNGEKASFLLNAKEAIGQAE
jgi:TRAP-type C4-dicarboxylate transport system permease small subunit